jgi:acetyl-CoA C-acetyltransferase
MSRQLADELELPWLAEIGAHGVVAGPDSTLQHQPSRAIARACEKEGITPADLDLVEINEASPPWAWPRPRARHRPGHREHQRWRHALGHPIGMSGARIALHLALALQRKGGGIGAAALCGGGGQGDALVLRVPRGSAQ